MENTKVGFKQKMTNFFGKIKGHFKAFFNKEYLSYSLHKYKAFTALQFKEVFAKELRGDETKDKIIRIVLPIIKFLASAALTFVVLFLLVGTFKILTPISLFPLFVFFTTLIFILQVLSATSNCAKSYYIAEDNKVLITFPSSGASLFLSKLTIEFFKELKNTINLYLPIAVGILLFGVAFNKPITISLISLIWVFAPSLVACGVIVLIGSLLSVLYLQYLRLTKTFPIVRLIVLGSIFAGLVYLAVVVINLIPANISMFKVVRSISDTLTTFLAKFEDAAKPITWFCHIICGYNNIEAKAYAYKITWVSIGGFGLSLIALLTLLGIVFLVIKPLFLHMMTKSVDYEKVNEKIVRRNHTHNKYLTFTIKETKIAFRTLEIYGMYIVTYVLIPLLIFLLCKLFDAISTSMRGNMLSVMFIVLLIILPLLASNTPLASAYSREGHAGYIKKTKPVSPFVPMFSKLIFNLVLSIPSIWASMFIVLKFGKIDKPSIILLGISIMLLQYAHIFFSSTLDFTRPRNEYYQTEGQNAKNPNENISTVVAFVLAFVFAGLIFFLFNEQVALDAKTFIVAARRILIVSILIFGSMLTLYILKLKAFFLEK